MAIRIEGRGLRAGLLLIALPLALILFGMPAHYGRPLAILLTAAQLLLIGGAAFGLLAPAWRSGSESRRRIAIVGLLGIMPWALLTLMPGYGPPFAADLAQNHVRFIILFVSTAFVGSFLLSLKDPLAEAGDRLIAPLGLAAGTLATMIQLVWGGILIGWTMSVAHKPAHPIDMNNSPLANASDVLLFFAGLMTYLATIFYALSFARIGWLGRGKAAAMIAVAALAIVGLIMRGLQYPDLSDDWYTTPGMIVGIPAIPWLMPYMLGVCALFRASRD